MKAARACPPLAHSARTTGSTQGRVARIWTSRTASRATAADLSQLALNRQEKRCYPCDEMKLKPVAIHRRVDAGAVRVRRRMAEQKKPCAPQAAAPPQSEEH